MTNNLRKVKQDLRAYAKRCKDVHYTESLLIRFLITGILFATNNLFSASKDTNIENQRQTISTSIKNLYQQVKATRKENDKLLKQTNLELIQLMEQGDHVVKAPWSSWQYGINYFNNNWNGTYKGRGDKKTKYPYEGVFERSSNIYERTISPDSENYGLLSRNRRPNFASGSAAGYGIASFKPVREPIIPFEVNAGIRPRQVVKERITITAPTFTTPTAPETISFVPANPSVSINATPPTAPQSVSAPGTGNGPESYLLKNTGGVWDWQAGQSPYYTASNRATVALASEMSMDQLGGTRAELNYHVGGNVEFKNATLTSAGDTTGTGWPFTTTNYTVSGFNGYAIIKNVGNADIEIKNTDINYTGTGGSGTSSRWLFHTDAHNSSRTSAWTIDNSTRININGTQLMMYTSQLHHGNYNATFTNNGKVNEAGNKNVIWLALNERASVNRRTETFTNAGEITLNGTNGIFAYIDMPTTLNTGTLVGVPGVAPSTGNGDTDANSNAWVLTNSGKLTLNGSGNTGVFVSDSFRYWAAEIQLTNADNFKVDGTGNAGVYFKGWADLDGGATQNNGTDGTSTTSASTFNMNLTGTGNTGIYFNYDGDDSEPDTKKHTFKLTGTSTVKSSNKDNILIYNANGDVDLSNAITLNPNGKSNVGIYNKSADKLVTAAKIIGTGESATGIYSTGTGYTKNDGTITMTGEKVKGIVAGDSTNVGTAIIHNTGNVTVKGKEAVAVIAQKGGTVNLPYIDPVTNVKAGTPIITTEGQSALGLYATTNGTINAVDTTVNASGGAINVYKNGGNIKLKNSTLNTNADSLAFMTGGSGKIDFTSTDVTTANINSKGTAFYYDGSTSAGPTGYADFSNTGIQTWASNSFNNLNKLKLNMTASDSRMFIASQVKMNLADTNLTPANVSSLFGSNSPVITGVSDYKTFLLFKSLLTVANTDNVNLDNHNDPYNLLEISNSSITNNGTINGTQAGQYAMAQTDETNNAGGKEWVELTNNGTISLSGNNSTGIYAKAGKIVNDGNITVGNSSAGIYAVENTQIDNKKDITVGSSSTAIFYTDIFTNPVTGVVNTFITTTPLKNTGNIVLSGNDSVGMTYETDKASTGSFLENAGTLTATGDRSIGLYAKKARTSGSYTTTNSGAITMGDSATIATPNVAMYTDATIAGVNPLVNTGKITVGNNALGIYGFEVTNTGNITVGNAGIGIYSQNGDVNLNGGTIKTGTTEAVAVYTVGNGQNITNNNTTFDLGNNSFGFVNVGTGNTITSSISNVGLGDNNVYMYSNDKAGTVTNFTNITSTGEQNYGIYSAGTVTNNGNIDLSSGKGSVAIYSIKGGTATNNATITVGPSDVTSSLYSIGMGAGYDTIDTGNIVNKGTINVNGKYSIGMYASGAGSTATNDGDIFLNESNTTGIYADNGATAINNKNITTGSGTYTNTVGVYLGKDSKLINNPGASININAKNGVGVYLKGGIVENYGTITVNGVSKTNNSETDGKLIYEFTVPDTGKGIGGVAIDAPAGAQTATITVNGVPQIPTVVNTTGRNPISVSASSIGLYVNTSGVNYTRSIDGLQNLTSEADLIIGNEAAESTNSKYILVNDPNIINPYKTAMLSNPNIKWNVYSGSIGWIATPTLDPNDGSITSLYMAKVPYTEWAGRKATPVNSLDTYNFADGLEQRYGVKDLGTRERLIFTKLNGIGNNEEVLLYQAFDEMMGHQYGNLQQRINTTGNLLDKEFKYLKHNWRNPSKQSNKIKVFGMRDEYNTDTAGIINYTSNAYGVAYVHEDEKIKMGNSSGWYAGAVTNRFKFKDIGSSREDQTILKAGVFKTMSPKGDHNGALQWTIGGDAFVGINAMKRRYLVVDEVFQAKSDYHSYGAALKTDLGYDIRMSERTHLRPYGALKMEYGKFNDIKEDRGEMRLEIKGNDYFSVKPEVGMEFRYVQPLAVRTNLTVGVTAAYENELGKVGDVNNKGRVRYTTADWFGIRGEKEDRRGNGKFDLNIGVDNTRFGVTVNGGYDTKGNNVRAGIGFRAIY